MYGIAPVKFGQKMIDEEDWMHHFAVEDRQPAGALPSPCALCVYPTDTEAALPQPLRRWSWLPFLSAGERALPYIPPL